MIRSGVIAMIGNEMTMLGNERIMTWSGERTTAICIGRNSMPMTGISGIMTMIPVMGIIFVAFGESPLISGNIQVHKKYENQRKQCLVFVLLGVYPAFYTRAFLRDDFFLPLPCSFSFFFRCRPDTRKTALKRKNSMPHSCSSLYP